MSTTLLVLERNIAKELGYATGAPSASGTTTTIVDTSADSPFDTGDSSDMYKNAWAKIEADSAGTPQNVGEVRRISTYNPSSRTATLSTAFTNATTTTMTYGAYFRCPPTRLGVQKGLDEYINDTLRALYYKELVVLTLITDGDMETSGVANWTASNATVTKVTDVGKGVLGKQALRVVNSAANGYAQSVSIATTEDEVWTAMAQCLATAGTAKLRVWDVTNAAEIAAKTSTQVGWRWLYSQFAIPTGCKQLALRLQGVELTADCRWDNVSLRHANATDIALPTWVSGPSAVEELEAWSGGTSFGDSYAVDQWQRDAVDWFGVIADPIGQTAHRVEFWPVVPIDSLLIARVLRPYAELSADTDTTDANADWVKAGALARIYQDKPDGDKGARWAAEFKRLSYAYQPRLCKRTTLRPY